MISYKPFWDTLAASKETTYTLTNDHKVSSAILHKLRYNLPLNTTSINRLCQIFGCGLSDILEFYRLPNELTSKERKQLQKEEKQKAEQLKAEQLKAEQPEKRNP